VTSRPNPAISLPARHSDVLHRRACGEPAGAVTDVAGLGISSSDHMRVPVVGRDHRRDRGEPGAAPLALRAEKLRQRRRLVRWALGHEPHGTRRPNRSPSPVAAAITSRIMAASTVGGFRGFRMGWLRRAWRPEPSRFLRTSGTALHSHLECSTHPSPGCPPRRHRCTGRTPAESPAVARRSPSCRPWCCLHRCT
jgi:hypothetical protein